MMTIIAPILALGLLGVAFAVLLGVSFRKFAVHIDPKLEKLLASLPGSNCGACGYAGCLGLAEAIAAGTAEPTGCVAGGNATAQAVAGVLGVSLEPKTELVAFVSCRAGRSTARMKYVFEGVSNCQAANIVFGGDKACAWGCLGLGSCERACPFDAIHVNADGLAMVDRSKCTSCAKCVAACPRHLIDMVPKAQDVLVACKNHERGKRAKDTCPIACTACKICEKNCPEDAIHVIDDLAVIDYAKCTQCGICVQKCPPSSIISVSGKIEVKPRVKEKEPVAEG
jgi:electron transport complex protein RnfB